VVHNALHDEGPAWSPDGTMLAYSSGPENLQLDINVKQDVIYHLAPGAQSTIDENSSIF